MKEYKNIDDLFKENISDFNIEPETKSLDNILSKVSSPKSYLREIILILALLMIGGSSYLYFNYPNPDNVHSEKSSINNSDKNYTRKDITNSQPEVKASTVLHSTVSNTQDPAIKTNSETINIIIKDATDNYKVETIQNTETEVSKHKNNIINKPYTANHFITLGRLSSKYKDQIIQDEDQQIMSPNDIIEISDYIEKKRKFHLYTGASLSVGIMYYNDTPDQFTWSSDLNIGYTIKDFYVESGIGFKQVKQHGDYRIEYETNDSVGYYNQVLSFQVNPTNPTEIIYNTKTKTVYDSVGHYTHQSPLYQYSYINVPLVIGYKFLKNDKLTLSCETGLIFSILSTTKKPDFVFDNPESKLVEIVNYTPERVKNNLRLHLALRANYRINRSISINLQPEFSSYLNSVYKESSNKKQRPYSIGLRVGLLFNF